MKNLIIILVGMFLIGCEGVEEEIADQVSRIEQAQKLDMQFGYDLETGETFECYQSLDTNECSLRQFQMIFVSLRFADGGYQVIVNPTDSIEIQGNTLFHYESDFNNSRFAVTGSDNDVVLSLYGDFGSAGQIAISADSINDVEMTIDQSILDLALSL